MGKFTEGEKFFQLRIFDGFHIHIRTFDRLKLDLSPDYNAGQTKTTDSGLIHFFILTHRTNHARAVRACHFKPCHMTGKGADAKMVLTMNIIGNGTAH